jgi:ubiquinone/menaquinone biosynthesis C-methylase UbiE
MNQRNKDITRQYHLPGLFEAILGRLQEEGIEPENVTRSDIAGVDEFHVRGAEVSKELVMDLDLQHMKVLDVGCGIGGPARMLAAECNCQVWGVDMSHEFITTAQKLSELVGLGSKTTFLQGDALDLPFSDGTFDLVWTQHVQMNIEDKRNFYSEINRVLRKNGVFIYYDIFIVDGEDVNYPVPWANEKSISFLQTIENMDSILGALGFTREDVTDQTARGIAFFKRMLETSRGGGPPKIGLNLLMGGSTKEKLGNILTGLEENKIELQSGIYKK